MLIRDKPHFQRCEAQLWVIRRRFNRYKWPALLQTNRTIYLTAENGSNFSHLGLFCPAWKFKRLFAIDFTQNSLPTMGTKSERMAEDRRVRSRFHTHVHACMHACRHMHAHTFTHGCPAKHMAVPCKCYIFRMFFFYSFIEPQQSLRHWRSNCKDQAKHSSQLALARRLQRNERVC